jgi:hypothetical protein
MTESTAPSTEYQKFTSTPPRWYEWLPLPGLLAFAMYLCRGQAEILLRQLQQPDTQSYGLSTIGGGLQNQVSAARAAIRLWKGGGSTAHIAAVFVAADSLFTLIGFAAFGALLWTAMRRSLKIAGRYPWPDDRPFRWYRWPLWGAQDKGIARFRPLSAYLTFGALLVIARLLAFATNGSTALIWAAWIFQKLQWATLAITLLVLVAAIRDAITEPKPAEEDEFAEEDHGRRIRAEVRASWDRYWLAILVLRGQVGLAVLWSLLFIIDATGQVSDLLRGWTDRWFGFGVGLASVLLFGALPGHRPLAAGDLGLRDRARPAGHRLRQSSRVRRPRAAGADYSSGAAGTARLDALRGLPAGPDRSAGGPLRRPVGCGQQAARRAEWTDGAQLQLRPTTSLPVAC